VHTPVNGAVAPITLTGPAGTLVVSWHATTVRPTSVAAAKTEASATPAIGVQPNSASGCNQDVCIQINGYSNYISYWGTTGFNDGPLCSWPDWWYALNVVATTDILCVDDAGVFIGDWYPNRRFTPNPATACNSWWAINGFPCETVRK
jgi:hypothetical protein